MSTIPYPPIVVSAPDTHDPKGKAFFLESIPLLKANKAIANPPMISLNKCVTMLESMYDDLISNKSALGQFFQAYMSLQVFQDESRLVHQQLFENIGKINRINVPKYFTDLNPKLCGKKVPILLELLCLTEAKTRLDMLMAVTDDNNAVTRSTIGDVVASYHEHCENIMSLAVVAKDILDAGGSSSSVTTQMNLVAMAINNCVSVCSVVTVSALTTLQKIIDGQYETTAATVYKATNDIEPPIKIVLNGELQPGGIPGMMEPLMKNTAVNRLR